MSKRVQYQVIDRDMHEGTEFVVDGQNIQFNYQWASVGLTIHIAMKEDVRPAARPKPGITQKRYYAPYVQNVIVEPEVCTSCAHEEDPPIWTICPNCIESWAWDWFIRYEPKWTSHGTYNSYSSYGCRCPLCRVANKKHFVASLGQDASNITKVGAQNGWPEVTVTPDMSE